MSTDDVQSIVIDNGSDTIKFGYSGQKAPKSSIPSVVGHSKLGSVYVGSSIYENKNDHHIKYSYPLDAGVVKNWDDLEKLWNHIFENELGISSDILPVLFSDPPLNSHENREKMSEIMFEKYKVPSLNISNQGLLSLFSAGLSSGVAVDSGHTYTTIVPVYEGFPLVHAIEKFNIGGRDVTNYLEKVLTVKEPIKKEYYRIIKEKCCFVNYQPSEISNIPNPTYVQIEFELPDGTKISLDPRECCLAPEILFEPFLLDLDVRGIDDCLFKSINKSQIDFRRTFYSNILLSGGNTLFSGFGERLAKELDKLAPESVKVNVIEENDRKFSTWIGGSIFASLDNFRKLFVSKAEYDEFGSSILRKRFS